jgi:isopentenyl-diphosphate delta-isomerase
MEKILSDLGYDGLCIHLNPAQELVQPEGDRDFRGITKAIQEYSDCFGERLIVKETGAGMSPRTLDQLKSQGIVWVDVSGKGGTSWTRVEARRNPGDSFGETVAEWGIPTVVSLLYARARGFCVIASGGIRSPLDLLKALTLGARLGGIARPILVVLKEHGYKGGEAILRSFEEGLKRLMILVRARNLFDLSRCRYLLSPRLKGWLELDLS